MMLIMYGVYLYCSPSVRPAMFGRSTIAILYYGVSVNKWMLVSIILLNSSDLCAKV